MAEKRKSKGLKGENSLKPLDNTTMSSAEKEGKRVSRREFVKGTAVGAVGVAAAGVLAGCAPAATPTAAPAATPVPCPTCEPCPTPWLPEKWDEEADVVVLGAGGAGLAAAIEACTAGARVLVLEKEPVCGGSSAISGGEFAAAWTSMQKEQGIEDSPDLFYADLEKIGKRMFDPELLRAYVDSSNDCFEFLTGLGVEFIGDIAIYPGFSAPRAHHVNPAEVIRILQEEAIGEGAEILLETAGKRLITDEKKRVIGVEAETGGKTLYCKAKRAVVLASGGFSRNPEMLDEFSTRPMGLCIPVSGPGHTGDGHRMAMELGAATRAITLGIGPSCATDLETNQLLLLHYDGAVIVNKEGKRFVNESIGYVDIGLIALDQPDALIIQIIDAPIYEKSAYAKVGAPKTAGTIEELAKTIGVPPEALRETIDKYNSYVEAGADPDFGRTTLVGIAGKPVKIETPPFYAFITKPGLLSTKGGLQVNAKTQVKHLFGEIIRSLYAPGEIMGGFHGAGYHTGTQFGKALVFGRIAGRNAAAETPWE